MEAIVERREKVCIVKKLSLSRSFRFPIKLSSLAQQVLHRCSQVQSWSSCHSFTCCCCCSKEKIIKQARSDIPPRYTVTKDEFIASVILWQKTFFFVATETFSLSTSPVFRIVKEKKKKIVVFSIYFLLSDSHDQLLQSKYESYIVF